MASPIFSLMGNSNNTNMIKKFMEFKRTFQGDPKQEVQNLLNSGRMTQEQYNQLSNMASNFQQLFKK